MFGKSNMFQRYGEEKSLAAKLPSRTVTSEEFVKLMVAEGTSEQEARMQAKVARVLGGKTRIGQEMIAVKDE